MNIATEVLATLLEERARELSAAASTFTKGGEVNIGGCLSTAAREIRYAAKAIRERDK